MTSKINFGKLREVVKKRKTGQFSTPENKSEYGATYKSPLKYKGQRHSTPNLLERKHSPISHPPRQSKPIIPHYSHVVKPKKEKERKQSTMSTESGLSAGGTGEKRKSKRVSYAPERKKSSASQRRMDEIISGYYIPQEARPKSFEARKSARKMSIMSKRSIGSSKGDGGRRNTVTFLDGDVVVPHRQLRYRDGSMTILMDDIARISTTEDEEPDQTVPEENDKTLEKLDESLDKIRNLNVRQSETMKEFKIHRKHFLETFSVYVVLAVISAVTTSIFVFWFNHGVFTISSEEDLAANESLYEHEYERVYLNSHMLLMTIPTLNIFGVSTLIYRIYPNKGRARLKYYHGTANFIGTICFYGGCFCAFQYHVLTKSPHFRCLHSYIGLCAVLNHCVNMLSGLTYILPCFKRKVRICLIPFHRTTGINFFMVSIAAALTGTVTFSKKYFKKGSDTGYDPLDRLPYSLFHGRMIFLNLVGISTLCSIGFLLYLQTNYLFRHRRMPNLMLKKETMKQEEEEELSLFKRGSHGSGRSHMSRSTDGNDDAQLGSRKSFVKRHFHQEKSIPILINEAEKQKANFTDVDFLLALE